MTSHESVHSIKSSKNAARILDNGSSETIESEILRITQNQKG